MLSAVRLRAGLVAAIAALVALAPSCGEDAPPPERAEPPDAPLELSVTTVVRGLETPWGLAHAGDVLLVTERAGRVRAVREGALAGAPVARPEVVAEGEGGLLGIAVHPGYPEPPWVYVYATVRSGGAIENRITRYTAEEQGPAGLRLTEPREALGGIPASRVHNGGDLAFGPDGMLYATTGDAGVPASSAERGSLAGKILRLAPDGSIPADNPIDGSPVYAYGFRNSQGMTWDAEGGLYATDHGPTGEFGLCCRDELILVEPGTFHGWPFRSGGAPALDAAQVGVPEPPDAVDPVATSGPADTWAPAGAAFLGGARSSSLVFATLAGAALRHVVIDRGAPRRVLREEVALDGEGRLRAVLADGEDCVLLTTSNRDGRGEPAAGDDRVLRACAAG